MAILAYSRAKNGKAAYLGIHDTVHFAKKHKREQAMPSNLPILHFANTFFEHELEQLKERSLEELLPPASIPLQLQFLPLLYRHPGEKVLVSLLPSESYLYGLSKQGFSTQGIECLEHPPSPPFELALWGASRAAIQWANLHGGTVFMPEWDCVREVHSKLFAFMATSQLPHSRLLQTAEEAEEWISSFSGPKVLKKAFGLAGSGHLRADHALPSEALNLFDTHSPLIGEPWVKRLFDFSTQWHISDTIQYLGATVLDSSDRGMYLGNWAGDEDRLFQHHFRALQEHLDLCRPILKRIRALGFFGHLGIDAFVYEWEGVRYLRAMSEINARKTMGWAALQIQRLHYPNRLLNLRYEKTLAPGFLPIELGKSRFQRQLLLITQ